mgnify:CR=1 FL=1
MLTVALVGNPNCGKTTLFNTLTGSTAHVGNWPGVTVDKKVGVYKKDNILVVEGNKGIKKINLLIGEYPFFPTDLQQIITVVLTKAKSSSTIEDPIFPNRILHLKELKKIM